MHTHTNSGHSDILENINKYELHKANIPLKASKQVILPPINTKELFMKKEN